MMASVVYYLVLSVISHIPGQTIADTNIQFWDKGAHFLAYSLLGFFFMMSLIRRRDEGIRTSAFLKAVVVVAFAGAADEIHQYFVPGRESSFLDFIADALGGTAGAALAVLWTYPSAVLNHFRNSRANIR